MTEQYGGRLCVDVQPRESLKRFAFALSWSLGMSIQSSLPCPAGTAVLNVFTFSQRCVSGSWHPQAPAALHVGLVANADGGPHALAPIGARDLHMRT